MCVKNALSILVMHVREAEKSISIANKRKVHLAWKIEKHRLDVDHKMELLHRDVFEKTISPFTDKMKH